MVEFYNVVDADYINLCKQQVLDVRIKVELLDHYEHTIGEVTTKVSSTSGSISVKYNQGVRRTCDITIDDINKEMLPNNENSVFFVNKKFKIYIGLYKKNWSKSGSDGTGVYHNSQDDTIYWFSQGVFVTKDCDYDKKNGVLHLSGVDKFGFFTKDLNQHTLQNTYHISADSKLGQLISDIITIDMGNGMPTDTQTPIIHTSFVDQVLPYDIEKTANETIGDILIEIATAFNADIYYDVDGHLVFEPNIIDDYSRQSPVFEFGKNDYALIDMTLDFNYGDIVNQITVTGDNSDGVVYSSTATNENPVSSLRVSNIGIKAADIEETAMGYSDKRCSDYANYLLKKKMRMAIAGTITCTPLPHLDCNRVVKVYQNEEDVNEIDFLIEEVQIPLSPETYSLSVCNIQDLPLTCYTSMIPQSELSEWVAFRDTDSLGKYINRDEKTFAVAPIFVNGRTMTAIGGSGYLEDGSSSGTSVLGLDIVENLVIENGIKIINIKAFYNCTSLKSIIIPDSITNIKGYAFCYCTNLKNIIIPHKITSIEEYVCCYCTNLTSVTIPDTATSIGKYAFYNCISLKSITLPNSVISIGSEAFGNCSSLENITIGGNIMSIGTYAFSHCSSLKSITLPDSVTSIDNGVFSHCTSLASINIPDSVKSIEAYTFDSCTSLESITIPNSVTSIGINAFSGCTGLTSMDIPDSVIRIYGSAFNGCTALESVTIPDSVISIASNVFYHTAMLENQTGVKYADTWIVDCDVDVTSAEIKAETKGIADETFYGCTSLESVTIPNSVTWIGSKAFYNCTSLTSITTPNSVTSIGYNAFYNCSSLESIIINNPNCSIYDSKYTISDTAVIYGYANSTAQSYAKKYSRTFIEITIPSYTNLIFSTKLEFPDIGSSENLYIATDENAIYRFDSSQNDYICLNELSGLKPVAFSGSYNDLTDIPDIEGILGNI